MPRTESSRHCEYSNLAYRKLIKAFVSSYNSEEGLCLQDNSNARVSVPVVTQTQTNGQKMVSAVSAPTEFDLNTPLVQDDTQDPLRAMFRRK